jgi:hypothetical protein
MLVGIDPLQVQVVRHDAFYSSGLEFWLEFAFGMIWVKQLGWEAHGHQGWMLLNFIILYQFVQMKFATKDLKGTLTIFWSKIAFHTLLLSMSIWALFAAFIMETNDYGGVYSSFLIQFVTSLLTT